MTTIYRSPVPCRAQKAKVEAFAESVFGALKCGYGDTLAPIVETLGGKISYDWLDDDASGGAIIVEPNGSFEIKLSSMTSPLRDRFTVAHELGHYFLHFSIVNQEDSNCGMKANRTIDPADPDQKRAEWEANWFAASFLMPRKAFEEAYDQGGLDYAAAKFNVSRSAAEVRASSIKNGNT